MDPKNRIAPTHSTHTHIFTYYLRRTRQCQKSIGRWMKIYQIYRGGFSLKRQNNKIAMNQTNRIKFIRCSIISNYFFISYAFQSSICDIVPFQVCFNTSRDNKKKMSDFCFASALSLTAVCRTISFSPVLSRCENLLFRTHSRHFH